MALSKIDGTNFIDPTIPVASGGTGLTSGFVNGGTNTPSFQATVNAAQTIATGTATKINFNTENFDTDGTYDVSLYNSWKNWLGR